MNRFIFLFGIFIFASFKIFAQTPAPPESDFQFWHETTVAFPLLKKKADDGKEIDKVSFILIGTFRAGENLSRPIDQRVGVGFDYFVNKHLSFAPSYVYRAGRPYGGREEFEHRIRFDLTLGKNWSRFSLRNRNRVEYRARHFRANSVRYRNRTQFNFPIQKNKKEILTPYAYTEPFYDFSEKKWIRNEFAVGVSRKINRNLTADFFYVQQNTRSASLQIIRGIGVNLRFKVD